MTNYPASATNPILLPQSMSGLGRLAATVAWVLSWKAPSSACDRR